MNDLALTSAAAERWLREGKVLPEPLHLEVVQADRRTDFRLRLSGMGLDQVFDATFKNRSSPRDLRAMLPVPVSGQRPLILVLPFLSANGAALLLDAQVSAVDLCGNYQIVVPGKLLLQRLDRPNRYPSSSPILDWFNGTSSLVPRVLLGHRSFDSAQALRHRILELGGTISKGTVSKVLARLRDQLWVRRNGGIRLVHPDAMLEAFVAAYRLPRVRRRQAVKIASTQGIDAADAVWFEPERFVVQPTVGALPILYVRDIGDLLERGIAQQSARFPDAELVQTADPGVYFASDQGDRGRVVSALEVYLQLMSGGQRERDAAAQLRPQLVGDQL